VGLSHTAHAQHDGDLFVGRTQQGRLRIAGFDWESNLIALLPVTGLLRGWTDNDPGFDRVVDADAARNLFPLAPGVRIWLEVVAVDPAFRAIDNALQTLDRPGRQTYLGDHSLHTHLTWHINSSNPEFDASRCVWEATFVLKDLGMTGYAASDPFTMRFTNVSPREPDGDFDRNGRVDFADTAKLVDCLSGEQQAPLPHDTCPLKCLLSFDFDDDDDIDLMDAARFQSEFAGE
jgi:hypothetical protein